jgi:hypothetical protein
MTTAPDSFREGYATYTDLPDYSHKCIDYLMNNNELMWKLLKYNEPNAWSSAHNNLTFAEKAELIYNSQPDSTPYRVFMDSGNPDVWTREICQLRIYPIKVFPQDRTRGMVLLAFEVFCHYKINQLSNYKTRVDMGVQQIIATFNGINIGGIGRLYFDGAETAEDRTLTVGQLPFKGKCVYMSNKDI